MTIDDTFNLTDYVSLQAQHIEARYYKHCSDTAQKIPLTQYLQDFYIPLGHAKTFHIDYMAQHHNRRFTKVKSERE